MASVWTGEHSHVLFYSYFYTIHDFSFTGISVGICHLHFSKFKWRSMSLITSITPRYFGGRGGFLKPWFWTNLRFWRYALFLKSVDSSFSVIRGCGAMIGTYCDGLSRYGWGSRVLACGGIWLSCSRKLHISRAECNYYGPVQNLHLCKQV